MIFGKATTINVMIDTASEISEIVILFFEFLSNIFFMVIPPIKDSIRHEKEWFVPK